jgi:hypothetical protein
MLVEDDQSDSHAGHDGKGQKHPAELEQGRADDTSQCGTAWILPGHPHEPLACWLVPRLGFCPQLLYCPVPYLSYCTVLDTVNQSKVLAPSHVYSQNCRDPQVHLGSA